MNVRFGLTFTFALSVLSFFLGPHSTYAVSENCTKWFANLKLNPRGPECEIKCATADVDMGTFDCPSSCKDLCKTSTSKQPCDPIKNLAKSLRTANNHCDTLAKIAKKAVHEAQNSKHKVEHAMNILREVLIGEDLTRGRGNGPCFAGQFKGANGFRKDLQDPHNQIQHAMAGIYIGYQYGWLGCAYARWREEEPQDDKLYEVTCRIGRNLTEKNLNDLPEIIRQQIGDASCRTY